LSYCPCSYLSITIFRIVTRSYKVGTSDILIDQKFSINESLYVPTGPLRARLGRSACHPRSMRDRPQAGHQRASGMKKALGSGHAPGEGGGHWGLGGARGSVPGMSRPQGPAHVRPGATPNEPQVYPSPPAGLNPAAGRPLMHKFIQNHFFPIKPIYPPSPLPLFYVYYNIIVYSLFYPFTYLPLYMCI
jgi:hypothetical protein